MGLHFQPRKQCSADSRWMAKSAGSKHFECKEQLCLQGQLAMLTVLSVDYCSQTCISECFKGTIIMLFEAYNHIIAGVRDSLRALLQAVF